jgi:hypothetical protein
MVTTLIKHMLLKSDKSNFYRNQVLFLFAKAIKMP